MKLFTILRNNAYRNFTQSSSILTSTYLYVDIILHLVSAGTEAVSTSPPVNSDAVTTLGLSSFGNISPGSESPPRWVTSRRWVHILHWNVV